MNKDELLKLKNKDFIFTCLKILSQRNEPDAVYILTNASICKSRFDMNFPILQKVSPVGTVEKNMFTDSSGNRRYYPETIVIDGTRYIVCNDWYYNTKGNRRDTRTAFVNWVLR